MDTTKEILGRIEERFDDIALTHTGIYLNGIGLWKEELKTSGIYALMGPDGEIIYIGQSKNIFKRLRAHNNPHQIQNTLRQIAEENGNVHRDKQLALYMFIDNNKDEIGVKILEFCEVAELNEAEKYYIEQYKPRFNYEGVNIPFKGYKREEKNND